MIYTTIYKSPCGELILGDYNDKLCLCDWNTDTRHGVRERVARILGDQYSPSTTPLLDKAVAELNEYFDRERHTFEIPVILCGTPFQKEVWDKLSEIRYGKTKTYGQLSEEIHRPNSYRAVASAARANALSIIIPCHRLIGAGHRLIGYAGGLGAKQLLLELENRERTESLTHLL